MKFFLQCVLLILFVLVLLFSYNKYFVTDNKMNLKNIFSQNKEVSKDIKDEISIPKNNKNETVNEKNNLIKNLKYEIQLSDNKKYIINSNLSELTFVNEKEIVYMSNVEAILIDKKNIPLKIEANEAIFDSSNNYTKFSNNIKIIYLDNTIFCEKVDFDLNKNSILIYKNVLYKSQKGEINTDNIKIDLNTNNVVMFMNNSNQKIQMKSY